MMKIKNKIAVWFSLNFREPESSAVDVLGKSLYVDLNQLSTLRRPSAVPVVAAAPARRTRCFEPESTRSGAKSILLTEDVLSVSDYSSLTALRPSRYSFCSQGDLEPDLIQVIFSTKWHLNFYAKNTQKTTLCPFTLRVTDLEKVKKKRERLFPF